jgi:RNA polymerase sigma factor (sigma-70 family)
MQRPTDSGDRPPRSSAAAVWTDADRLDEPLMRRVRDADDHAAFAELLPRLRQAIDHPLVRYLPVAELDDGRAEVALRIWARRTQYDAERGTPRMWARGISRNYAWDWLRKAARGPRVTIDPDGILVADRHPCPALAAEEAEWADRLECLYRETLAGLPPHARTSFELRLRGVSYAGIARATGRPIGTIASEVFRARVRLLTALRDASGEEEGTAAPRARTTPPRLLVTAPDWTATGTLPEGPAHRRSA